MATRKRLSPQQHKYPVAQLEKSQIGLVYFLKLCLGQQKSGSGLKKMLSKRDRREYFKNIVLQAAIALVASSNPLPESEMAWVPIKYSLALCDALENLKEEEERLFGYHLKTAHVMLERTQMNSRELALDHAVDMADALLLACVHASSTEPDEIERLSLRAIANFKEALRDYQMCQ